MSLAYENGPEDGSDDMLAAEYVLGAISADERQHASRRIEAEPLFARLVDQWEVRLSPLASAYAEAAPPASLKAALDRRLFGSAVADERQTGRSRLALWTNLAFWRTLAAAGLAGLAVYVAIPLINPPTVQPPLVASLGSTDSDVKYLVVYDANRHEVGLSHLSGGHASGKDFELWLIEGSNAPVPMGLVPAGQAVRVPVSPSVGNKITQGDVLAISIEPTGGSPTGQPTGPVVATGDLKSV
jgi:anti-sigma-K factor RskA